VFRLAKRLILTAALVVPALVGFAAASAGATMIQGPSALVLVQVTPPNVNLVGSGSSVIFTPSQLSLMDMNGKCTRAHGGWTLTNLTPDTQTVLYGHTKFAPLPPAAHVDVCGTPGKYVFRLKSSPNAKLTVMVKRNYSASRN
jgi:hypothetical protein